MKSFFLFLSIPGIMLLLLSVALNQPQQQAAADANTRTITIDLLPRISTLVVDDRLYLPDELPLTFSWQKTTIHQIRIEKPEVSSSLDKKTVFQRWTDLNNESDRTFVVSDNYNLRAIFEDQYRLRLTSEHGMPYGDGWFTKGETATFGVKLTNADSGQDGSRYLFASWDGGDSKGSQSNSIYIQGPTTVKATWYQQYYLEVSSSIPGGAVGGSGWYDKGQKALLSAGSDIDSGDPNTKYVFNSWSSLGNYQASVTPPREGEKYSTLLMDHPYKVQGNWKKAYYLQVQSPYSSTAGTGFYPEGSLAKISVSPSEFVTKQDNEKLVFDGWSGRGVISSAPSGSGQVRVTEPATVIAKWKTQYYLGISSGPGGSATGAGWYDVGSMAKISTVDPPNLSVFWMKTVFDKWTGDLSSDTTMSSITMDSPKTVKALWKTDYTPAFINGGILAAVAIAGIIVARKFRKPKKARRQMPELGGGVETAKLTDPTPTWQTWRAKIVDRTGEFEPTPTKSNRDAQ